MMHAFLNHLDMLFSIDYHCNSFLMLSVCTTGPRYVSGSSYTQFEAYCMVEGTAKWI